MENKWSLCIVRSRLSVPDMEEKQATSANTGTDCSIWWAGQAVALGMASTFCGTVSNRNSGHLSLSLSLSLRFGNRKMELRRVRIQAGTLLESLGR